MHNTENLPLAASLAYFGIKKQSQDTIMPETAKISVIFLSKTTFICADFIVLLIVLTIYAISHHS